MYFISIWLQQIEGLFLFDNGCALFISLQLLSTMALF